MTHIALLSDLVSIHTPLYFWKYAKNDCPIVPFVTGGENVRNKTADYTAFFVFSAISALSASYFRIFVP